MEPTKLGKRTRLTVNSGSSGRAAHGLRFVALLLVAGLAFAAAAAADTQSHTVYLDTDDNPATGCTATTAQGPFTGAELALVTTVTTSPTDAKVTSVGLASCNGGVFGRPQLIRGDSWPVGLGLGNEGTAVIETIVPLSALGRARILRVSITSTSPAGSVDAMLVAPGGGPILIALAGARAIATAPALSTGLLSVLVAILLLSGWRRLVRRRTTAAIVAMLLLGGAAVVLAAVTLDGQIGDWVGQAVRASSPLQNPAIEGDLVSFYAQVADGNLYFRIDAEVRPGAPEHTPSQTATRTPTQTPTGTPIPSPTGTPTYTATLTPTATPTPTATQTPTGMPTTTATATPTSTLSTFVVTLDAVADQTVPTNTTLSLRLAGHSTDALAVLTYTLVSGPSGAAVTASGIFGFTPGQPLLGNQSVTVGVQDGSGHSAQRTFHVAVVDHNHPPVLGVLTDDVTTVGAFYTKTLTATDPDVGDTLTFSLLSGPAGTTLTGSQLAWTPTAAQLGNWPVQVKVTDQAGASDSGTFHVGLPLVEAVDDHYSVVLGQTLAVAAPGVLGNDMNQAGGAPLTAQQMSSPDKGTLNAFHADGSFTYTAPPGVPPPPVLDAKRTLDLGPTGGIDIGYYPPLVADLDGDGKPEIIYWDGDTAHAIHGDTGVELFNAGAGLPAPYDQCAMYGRGVYDRFAVGDIDDDGVPEIVMSAQCRFDNPTYIYVATNASRVIAISYDKDPASTTHWKVKWLSQPLAPQAPAPDGHLYVPFGTEASWVEFTIARLRPAEAPTVLLGQTYGSSNCGRVIPGKTDQYCRIVFTVDGATGNVKTPYYSAPAEPASVGAYQKTLGPGGYPAPVVADIEGTGQLEILYEGTLWTLNGAVRRQFDGTAATGTATEDSVVVDLEGTGEMDVVTFDATWGYAPGWLKAWKPDGTPLWSLQVPRYTLLSKLSVGDIDRSGRPSILFGINNTLWAVDATGHVRWLQQILPQPAGFHVFTENSPTMAIYDLNGDGVPEIVVQNAKSQIQFLNGKTGALQYAYTRPEEAYLDGGQSAACPLVADVDGSGHASVVWYHDVNLNQKTFLQVLAGDTVPWQPAPTHFNQRAYWETNFNADGSIPLTYTRQTADPRTNLFDEQPQAPYVSNPLLRTQTSFTYTASNGSLTAQPATVSIDLYPIELAPVVTSMPPTSATNVGIDWGTPFTYQIVAIDPNTPPQLPLSYQLTYQGCGDAGRVTVSATGLFAMNQGPPDKTLCTFQVAVSNTGGGSTSHPFSIFFTNQTVAVPNVVGMSRAAAVGALVASNLQAGAISQAPDPSPAGTVLQQAPLAGASVLLQTAIALVVSSGPPNPPGPPPSLGGLAKIVVTPSSATRVTGETAPFQAIGTYSDGTGADITTAVTWTSSQTSVANVDTGGTAHAASAGTTTVTAEANGLVGSASLAVIARSAGDQVPPTVAITQPASGATVTGPTQVLGTAADVHFLRYELSLAASGDTTFTTFASGTSPVTAGVLGTLDPTLLLNGAYTLRLTVWDANGNTATADVPVVLDGAMKVGSFTITYTDMTVLLSGIPIQITRSYDSRDKRTGDFGVGWNLGVRALKVSASGTQGTGWQVIQAGTSWALVPGTDHFVSVTLPSGKVETFDLKLTPATSFLVPFTTLQASFVPRAGALGTLRSLDNTNILIADPQPGPVTLLDDATLNPFHPDRFLYTQKDGTQFVVWRTKGVESVKDLSGNQITLTAGGISHSSGASVAFMRDVSGRITGIVDPKGQTRNYTYSASGDLASTTDRSGNTTRYFYDAIHGLVRIDDPLGRPVARADYDDEGRLISVTDANGNSTTYTHDLPGRLEQIQDALGRITVLSYDERGNVLSSTDPLGRTTTATYDDRNNQLTATDALGKTTTWAYDAEDNVTSLTNPLGFTTTLTYDASGRPLTVTDARGHTTSSQYDASGQLVRTTDPQGHVISYASDSGGNLTASTNPSGATTQVGYDGLGRRTQITDPLGGTVGLQYDGNGNLVGQQTSSGFVSGRTYDQENRIVQTSAGGLQRTLAYDASGHLSSVTTAFGQTMPLTLDPAGKLLAVSSPAGAPLLQQTYDAAGNPLTATDALGNQTIQTYDAANQLVATKRPDGATDSWIYGPAGRLTNYTDALGRTTSFTGATDSRIYDLAGRVTSYTDALGRTTSFTYDAAGNLLSMTDALGGQTVYTYDGNGNQLSVTDPAGRTTQFAYDELDRLIATTYADSRTEASAYNSDGLVASRTDAAGNVTTYGYDAAGHLTTVTDPLGNITRYTYLNGDQPTSMTDANGHTTSFAYDTSGRLVTKTFPLGNSESSTFDAVGNPVSTTNGSGESVVATYDAQGRIAKVTRSDGASYAATYTADNLVDSVTGPAGKILLAYDPATRRLLKVTDPDGRSVRYAYDVAGNRTLVAHGYPLAELVTTYTYDGLNRLVQVKDPDGGVTTQAYDAVGNVVSVARPNGVTTTTAYDVRNHPISITETGPGPTTLSREVYSLDPLGNRTRVDRLDGSHVEYQYDALGRIVREKHFDASATLQLDLTYAYDSAGNLVSAGPAGAPVTFTYDVNDQLMSGGGMTYTYDLAGRRTQESWVEGGFTLFRRYSWDAASQLAGFQDELGATTTYSYDDAGLRKAKGGAPGTVSFLIDSAGPTGFSQLLRETSPSGTNSFVWGTRLLETVEAGSARYHLLDALGSTRLLTGAAGSASDTFDYEAYGRLLSHVGGSEVRHRFAAEESDLESGLIYLHARYYDPRTRAFLTRDPSSGLAEEPQTFHPYAYASGNPVNRIDPGGRETLAEIQVSYGQQLQAQGQRVLNVRRALQKTQEVIADTARVEGGLMAVEAVLESFSDKRRVNKWFFGGVIGSAVTTASTIWGANGGQLLAVIGSGIGQAVDLAAQTALARTAISLLSERSVEVQIEGLGLFTSKGSGLAQAVAGPMPSERCGTPGALAFAHRGFSPGSSAVIELCRSFFTSPPMPSPATLSLTDKSSMGGVMIHEFTHLLLRTVDNAYGCTGRSSFFNGKVSSGSATTTLIPGMALVNADSYRCWSEDAAINWGGSSLYSSIGFR